jgi:hypothetical protein
MTTHKIKINKNVAIVRRKSALIIYKFFVNTKLKNLGNTCLINLCINVADYYTMKDTNKICLCYLYCLEDYGEIYAFDIRTLHLAYTKKIFINPYSGNVINNAIFEHIAKKISFLTLLGFPIIYEQLWMAPSHNDIIYKMHMLDFDIKKCWIQCISLANIKKIYLECYSKYTRLNNAIRYNISKTLFEQFPTKKSLRIYLNNIITHEEAINLLFLLLDKFISDGKNKEYKKIGAMHFLQAVIKHGHSRELSNAFFYLD